MGHCFVELIIHSRVFFKLLIELNTDTSEPITHIDVQHKKHTNVNGIYALITMHPNDISRND